MTKNERYLNYWDVTAFVLAIIVLFSLQMCTTRPAHAGVSNGQPVNAAVTNAAFMDKNTATTFTIALADIQGGYETKSVADSTSTGSLQNVTLAGPITIFTNASLTSIQNLTFTNRVDATVVVLRNLTTGNLTLKNLSGGTAANQIDTGTGADLVLPNDGSVSLFYNTVASKWQIKTAAGADVNATNIATGTLATARLPTPIQLGDGSASTPSFGFSSETNTGMYRANTGELALALVGTQAFDIYNINSTEINFGFGGAASHSAGNALSANYTYSGSAQFNYSNLSTNTASTTQFYIGAGPSGANGVILQNNAYNTTTYWGGGAYLNATANLSFLNIASQANTGYITMNVGGGAASPTAANEIARFNTGDFTLAKPLKMNGSSSGTITIQTQAASGTYNLNLPTTAGSAGQVLTSQGGGSTAMTWTASTFTPTHTILTSTGTQTGVAFAVSGITTAPTNGATYTNNSNTFTVVQTSSNKLLLFTTCGTCTTSGSTLTKSGGTGDASITFSTTTATATYSPPGTATALEVECIAGGGGGGGTAAATNAGAGGGGGSGAYTKKFIGTPTTYNYAIGGGGAAGSAGNNAGGSGGGTYFVDASATLLALNGGGGGGGFAGGQSTPALTGTGGGAGAMAGGGSNGDVNIAGGVGGVGFVLAASQAMGGYGLSSIIGAGGAGSANTGAGTAGTGYGSGGGGGASVSAAGNEAGAAGGAGVCNIIEL